MNITLLDTIFIVVVILVFIVGPFWLIHKLDKHVAKKGALFTGQPAGRVRLFAIVLGIIFGGIFALLLFFYMNFLFYS